ncbi:MAG: hypothetical protein PHV30_11910 [Candidatus Margulisbacteria bacterium]|nr:hypothetical protein [Candidatus Margulisiibacteriota bacterium]
MDTVGAGSGGGIHPGAPIIWPHIKPQTQVTQQDQQQQEQQQTQQVQQNTPQSSTQTSQSTTATQSQVLQQVASTTVSSQTSASTPVSSATRALSTQDISMQLMSIGLADTPENQQLASKMLEYGMELSDENFQQLFKALQNKGANANTQNAALAAMSKGLAGNPAAVKALEQFFSGNINYAQQLQNLQQNISLVNQSLSSFASGTNTALVNNLTALLGEFDKNIKKIQNKDSEKNTVVLSKKETSTLQGMMSKGANLPPDQLKMLQNVLARGTVNNAEEFDILQNLLAFSQGLSGEDAEIMQNLLSQSGSLNLNFSKNFLMDLNALKALIAGLQQKLQFVQDPAERAKLMELLKNLESSITPVMENISAQGILSKLSKYYDPKLPDRYFYWIIPSPFAEMAKNIEILIKRDMSKKEAPVNPERTQVIIKMETEQFGDVAVIVEISGKDLWYLFHTESEDGRKYIAANSAMLRDQMATFDYTVKGISSQVKKIQINKILNPTIDLEDLRRIRTEA